MSKTTLIDQNKEAIIKTKMIKANTDLNGLKHILFDFLANGETLDQEKINERIALSS